jgi:hypothetical protein
VHYHSAADDRVFRSHDREVGHCYLVVGLALVVGLDIAEIACVPVLAVRQTMLVAFRVVVAARAHPVRGCAIAELMNVECMLLAGRQAFEVGDHFYGFSVLSEAHNAVALVPGRSVQNGDPLRDGGGFGALKREYRANEECGRDDKCFHFFHKGGFDFGFPEEPVIMYFTDERSQIMIGQEASQACVTGRFRASWATTYGSDLHPALGG